MTENLSNQLITLTLCKCDRTMVQMVKFWQKGFSISISYPFEKLYTEANPILHLKDVTEKPGSVDKDGFEKLIEKESSVLW